MKKQLFKNITVSPEVHLAFKVFTEQLSAENNYNWTPMRPYADRFILEGIEREKAK